MSILIIGGAGYIGSHCNKILSIKGFKTVVLDDFSTGHKDAVKWGTLFEGDLGNRDLLKEIFRKHKISCVMHFAAFAYVGESVTNPSKYYHNNTAKVLNLLDEMVESGIKKFIFSSTCATYGVPRVDLIDETHSQNPINPYGMSKLMVEKILEDYDRAYDLKSVCFRYFNAAGCDPDIEIGERHDPETHLIPLVLDVAIGKRESITIFGTDYETPDGTCIRDYIHVNDLSEAHILGIKFIEETNTSNRFNLGNGQGFSVKEIIDECVKVTGKSIKQEYGERRDGDPPKLVGNATKAKQMLNWNPKFSQISDIIETAWNFHKIK